MSDHDGTEAVQPMSRQDVESTLFAFEALESPAVTAVEHAPSAEAWAALVAAREDRGQFYGYTLPTAVRAFCDPPSNSWTVDWLRRVAEAESRDSDRERIAELPSDLVDEVRVAVHDWRRSTIAKSPAPSSELEDGFLEALVADLSEIAADVVNAAEKRRSKLSVLAYPAAWEPVIEEARGTLPAAAFAPAPPAS